MASESRPLKISSVIPASSTRNPSRQTLKRHSSSYIPKSAQSKHKGTQYQDIMSLIIYFIYYFSQIHNHIHVSFVSCLSHGLPIYRNYGCGAVYPEAVEGCSVLDLGSGAGIDCFVLSQLVGPNGHVTGIDMTQEQVSRKDRVN